MTPEEWSRLTPAQQAWHLQQMPGLPPQPNPLAAHRPRPPQPQSPPRRSRAALGWVGGILAVVALLVMISVAAAQRGSAPAASAPSSDSCRGAGCSATQAPRSPGAAAAAPAGIVASGPPRQITAREWAKIAKDPQVHVGEAMIVYGQVTQFDSVTGTSGFRANIDGVRHQVSYGYADYETNTILQGDPAALGDLVEGDLFRAEVVVGGTYTYETSLGGQMTVPTLAVSKIQVTGTAK